MVNPSSLAEMPPNANLVGPVPLSKAEAGDFTDVDTITFPWGMPGFEELRRFVLVGEPDTYPSLCLQSLDDPWVGFTVIDPYRFFPDYRCELTQADQDALGLTEQDRAAVLLIVFVPEDPLDMTANLLAPVVINPITRLGKQVILHNPNYSVRQYLIERER